MSWQAFHRCSCCQGCIFLDDINCRLHGHSRRLCDGMCPDRTLEQTGVEAVLTDDERARCEELSRHPAARFPLLTIDEMRRLLWYSEYFGEREHERPTTRRFPRLAPHEYKAVNRFIHPDAA